MKMNPLLGEDIINADVEARVFGDTVYLYGTPRGKFENQYRKEFHIFSSKDMEHFTDNGNSFCIEDVKWANPELGLWAPDCVCKNGKYYLYYCLSNGECGVAICDTPAGKFSDLGKIQNVSGIDPAILVDGEDCYLYWGQYDNISVAKLKENMTEIDVKTIAHPLTVKDHGYHEGVSARKIGDLYYLVYTDIHRHNHMPVCQGYAVSKSPYGGFVYGGILVDNFACDPKTWNNHGCIECIDGQWYIFYHCAFNNNSGDRRVYVEKIKIQKDGKIEEVKVTGSGASDSIPATTPILASSAVFVNGGCFIGQSDDSSCKLALTHLRQFCTAKYRYLKFDGENQVKFLGKFDQNGRIEIYLDGSYFDSVPFAKSEIPTITSATVPPVHGVHEVEFRFYGVDGWANPTILENGSLYQFSFQ